MRFILGLFLVCVASFCAASPSVDQVKQTYRQILNEVQAERIHKDYEGILSLGSRLAGSDGEAKTFDYAERELRRLGAVNVHRDPFR